MRKAIFIFYLFYFLVLNTEGQSFEWVKSTGAIVQKAVAVDKFGNVYTTGSFLGTKDFDPGPSVFNLISTGNSDIFVCKLDVNGNFIWAKQIGGSGNDNGNSIVTDTLGDIYLCGEFTSVADFDPGPNSDTLYSAGGQDIFFLKLDSSGNKIWAQNIGGPYNDLAKSIKIDPLGNIVSVGSFRDTVDFDFGVGVYELTTWFYGGCQQLIFGENSAFVCKMSPNGNLLWAKNPSVFCGSSPSIANSIAIDSLGNIHAIGNFQWNFYFLNGIGGTPLGSLGGWDIFIWKLDANGQGVWARTFGSASPPIMGPEDSGDGIAVDKYGNIYTTGRFQDSADFNPGPGYFYLYGFQTFISKLDYNGNFVWATSLGGKSYYTNSIAIDKNSNVVTVASFKGTHDFDPGPNTYLVSSNGDDDIFISKLDSNGNFVSIKAINGSATEVSSNIVLTDSGDLHIVGYCSWGVIPIVDFDPTIGVYNLTDPQNFVLKLGHCVIADTTLIQTACNSFVLNGQTYDSSDTYHQVMPLANGCDSVITLNLIINDSSSSTINQTACNSYILNGQTYDSSGTFFQTIPNANGCDSVITLNLVIYDSSSSIINQTACNTFILNGQTYDSSGTYIQTMPNANGCDSVLTLNLVIYDSSSSIINQTACNAYTFNGQIYDSSGTYFQTIPNANGCDSVITLNLVINVNSGILPSGALLTAMPPAAAYQWLTCNPFSLIFNQTGQTYYATVNGDYAVEVSINGCKDTTNCVTVAGVGYEEIFNTNNII